MRINSIINFNFLCLCLLVEVTNAFQCLDFNGLPVDWFIIYKLPELKHNKTILHEGKGYFYMDANSENFQLSNYPIDEENNGVFYTLQQIYKTQDRSMFYAMYNDQPPTTHISLNHGHTKGVLGFDMKQGFWLVHSIPKFPPIKKDGYSWASNAQVYGQSCLCVTYNSDVIDKIGQQFLYNYPKFYDNNINNTWPDFAKNNPHMISSIYNERVQGEPWNRLTHLTSSGGTIFSVFSKSEMFGKDLYDAWLAPYFKSDMLVETWPNGRGKLGSNCSIAYEVHNVDSIKLPKGIEFNNTKDHSKWAITTTHHWVCIGDINRESTQEKRAGGTVCFQNSNVWTNFNSSIGDIEKCEKGRQLSHNLIFKSLHNSDILG